MTGDIFKVLVVEDEPLERKALSILLERMKEPLEIKSVGTAPEFEELCGTWDPDVVLLDIHIPGGDGLSSLKRLREDGFLGDVVLITAYDVFQYAQNAMGLGVKSFLVKPVTGERLQEELDRVLRDIRERRLRTLEIDQLKTFIKNNRGSLALRMIQDLLRSGQVSEGMMDVMASLGLPPSRPCHLFGVISVASERGLGTDSLFLWDDFDKALGDEVVTVPWDGSLSFFLVTFEEVLSDVDRWLSRFLEVILRNDAMANVAYGGLIDRLESIPSAVTRLEEALEESLLEGMGRAVMVENSVDDPPAPDYDFDLETVQQQSVEAFLNNRPDLLSSVKESLDVLISNSSPSDLNMVKFMVTGLLGQVCHVLLRLKCDAGAVAGWSRRQMLNLISIQTPMALTKVLPEAFDQAWTVRESASDPTVIMVQQALHYIEANYDDVTLERVADAVHVSPSYLSRTFRRVLGDRFVDKVKSVRMDRAKVLLSDGVSVRDVAISVGYGNIAYFSTIFKQSTGCSPSDYRKKN
jgi:two-component system response regulator YesN